MKHHLTKIAALILAVCLFAIPVTGCLQVDGDRVALTIDGEKYSRAEALMYFHYAQYETEYNIYSLAQSLYGGLMNYWAYSSGDYSSVDMLREDAMQQMIQAKVLNKEAAKDGITLTEEEEKVLTRTVNRFLRDNEAVVNAAEASKDAVTSFIRENMIANKEFLHLTDSIDTSYDEEALTIKLAEGIIIAPKQLDGEDRPVEEQKELVEKYIEEALHLFETGQEVDLIGELYTDNEEIGVTPLNNYELTMPAEETEEDNGTKKFERMAWNLKNDEYESLIVENSDGSYVGYIARMVNEHDDERTETAGKKEMTNRRKTLFEEVYKDLLASYKKIHVYTEVLEDFNVSATLYDGSDYEEMENGGDDEEVYYID